MLERNTVCTSQSKTKRAILIALNEEAVKISRGSTREIFLRHWTLLMVWSSWCLSCSEEQSFLLNLGKRHSVVIYGLNYRDELKTAQQWLRQQGNSYQNDYF